MDRTPFTPICPICDNELELDKVKNCKKIGNYSEWICTNCQRGHEDGSRFGIEMQLVHKTRKIKFDCACEYAAVNEKRKKRPTPSQCRTINESYVPDCLNFYKIGGKLK